MSPMPNICQVIISEGVDGFDDTYCDKSPCVYGKYCKDHIDLAINDIKGCLSANDLALDNAIALHKDRKRNYEVWLDKLDKMRNQ